MLYDLSSQHSMNNMGLEDDLKKEHVHYSPEKYHDTFNDFDKHCHSGYSILQHIINECFSSDPIMKEYWFGEFKKAYSKFKEFMDEDCKIMYNNIYLVAKQQSYKDSV